MGSLGSLSPNGASPGSSEGPELGSGSEAAMERKRRRRMESNRESARRSRLRKQRHLDELTELAEQLREENRRALAALNVATRHLLVVEAQNAVLRTQDAELRARLQSLDEVLLPLCCLSPACDRVGLTVGPTPSPYTTWNWAPLDQPPMMTPLAETYPCFMAHPIIATYI